MENTETASEIPAQQKPSIYVEIFAGVSTYLTLSYIFIVNPLLLSKAGISISSALFATVISAAASTLLMGLWAKVPFAVAPAPSITAFFVSYVVLGMGLSWPAAMAAVVVSGFLSIAMAQSVRKRLIESIPVPLRVGIIFAVSGFLIASGFTQAKVISYSAGLLDFAKLTASAFISPGAIVLYTGLAVTVVFRQKVLKFAGAPLCGIGVAAVVAASYGIKSTSSAEFSWEAMTAQVGQVDFSGLLVLDARFILAMFVFFVIDFFGGVGKYVGLFTAMGKKVDEIDPISLDRSLKIDGVGNILGGFLGASSLAVFISSAVGIAVGGRSGVTAIVVAILMLLSIFTIPLIGTIPVEATSGILIFVAFLLIPYKTILGTTYEDKPSERLSPFDISVCLIAAVISFLSYGIDKAILVVFVTYTGLILWKGATKKDIILIVVTLLLSVAVIFQFLSQ
jgi:AGZA family xanthine/uracil permease-like MFS transporter